MLGPEYLRSPAGVSKFLVLVASAATLILSGSTRPTEFQKDIVDSTWKEDGLFYLSIAGIVMTLMSVAWGIILSQECSEFSHRIKEMLIFGIACIAFIIFGSGTLESALSIFSRAGECCQDLHDQTNNTCTLPGFLMDSYKYGRPVSPQTLDSSQPFEVVFPDIPECNSDFGFNSWRCTICVNEFIQPLFKIKGAAGAAGLIAAIAYFIVIFVGIRELRARARKPLPLS